VAFRYGIAVLAVALMVLVRLPLDPLIGGGAPFLFFFPVILIAAWYGGRGPGLLATALSAAAAEFFWIEPRFALHPLTLSDSVLLFLFLGVGTVLTLLGDGFRRARREAEITLEESRQQAEELRLAMTEAETARRTAEEANRIKDEFLATVSHELRTPLNAMMGWAQLLQVNKVNESDPEKRRHGLETILRNARLQAHLIDDLLDVSRIITGQMRLDIRQVDLVPVIEAAVESVRPAAEARQIRIRRLLDPLAGPVAGDPARLQQVAWNLLSNAVKFTPKGGRVEVRLERVNSHVEFIVADTGVGISPEFLPHVFDRFRQLDSSSTRKHGGLGLGLSIVRHLVEIHGGTVRVKSGGDGQGTTFIVDLPLSVAHLTPGPGEEARVHPRASDASGPPGDDPAPDLKGIRVLVVEDEESARETLRQILEHCGAEVHSVTSAAEALEELERRRPDVLLSDIGLPGEDGYSLIRRIRALPPERGGKIPAAALTAFARSEDRRRALVAGFQMHLAKPVDMAELTAVVARLARG
jgi:signal transduction histidine kinase/CheY-like chemotaxis protein